MLDSQTKRRIDTARDILVGKLPDPKSQVEQITIALIYKFMDDMDATAEELGGKREFFSGDYEKYGWKKLMARDLGGLEVLNLYAEAIQKMDINPNIPQLFRDIFKNAYLPYRDPETLKMFLKVIDDFVYDHSERLGDAFEYLLSVLGSQGEAGQFRTPRHIIDFMVDIIDPKKEDKILDPACGTAGFLISSYKHIIKHNSSDYIPEKDKEAFQENGVDISELTTGGTEHYKGDKLTPDERSRLSNNIIGYDISPDMVRLSLVNMYLHGFPDPKIYEYDTLTSEDNWNEYADVILANPPFMSPKGGIKPHKRFSVQAKRSEVLFVDYIAEHLTPNGRAAVIVPEGIIFQSGIAYKQLRKILVDNYLFAVVSLPAGVFNPYSGVKTSILLMDKALNKKTDKILFAKIENDGFDLGAQRRPIKKNDLPNAFNHIKEYIQAVNDRKEFDVEFIPNFILATKEKIAENEDWNLSGDRYKPVDRIKSKFKLVLLGEVANVKKGSTITKKDTIPGLIPVIAGGQQPAYFHNEYNREGNVITVSASGAYAGYVSYFAKPIFASDCSTIQSKNENIISTKYLYQLLKEKQEKIYSFQQGMGQPHVYPKDLKLLQIPLPPLEIQKEIVEEIDGYQKIIDGARQVVENYKPQIQIDPKWPMVELGEVITLQRGYDLPKKDFIVGACPVVGSNGIIGYHNEYKHLKPGVVTGRSGTIGKVHYITENYWPHNTSLFVNDFKGNHSKYIYYLLQSLDLKSLGERTSAVPSLDRKNAHKLKVYLPTVREQKNISDQLDNEQTIVDKNIELINIFEQKVKNKIASIWGE